MKTNGWPIYAKAEKQYLHHSSTMNRWIVSTNDYTKDWGGLRSPVCKGKCPSLCGKEWQYYNTGWYPNSSINVSCESRDFALTTTDDTTNPTTTSPIQDSTLKQRSTTSLMPTPITDSTDLITDLAETQPGIKFLNKNFYAIIGGSVAAIV